MGFLLYHELAYYNVQCIILAPSTMHVSVKNRKDKNDRMDACDIAIDFLHSSYKSVHVPTEYDNEIKEFIGLREVVIISWKGIK